jgi:hypothetical protein
MAIMLIWLLFRIFGIVIDGMASIIIAFILLSLVDEKTRSLWVCTTTSFCCNIKSLVSLSEGFLSERGKMGKMESYLLFLF